MSSVDDCPWCHREQGKRPLCDRQLDGECDQRPIHVDRTEKRHTSVHDLLEKGAKDQRESKVCDKEAQHPRSLV